MKHLLSFLAAFALAGLGFTLLVANMHAPPLTVLVTAALLIGVGLALAIPAQLKEALVILVPYLPDSLVGGRRKTDPVNPIELPPPETR